MMRTRTGCESCRERHIKCVRKSVSEKCDKCLEHNRDCVQTALHRFRPVKSVPQKGRPTKQALSYDSFQVWVDVPSKVDFGSSSDDTVMSDQPGHDDIRPMQTNCRQGSLKAAGLRDDSIIDYPSAFIWDSANYTTTANGSNVQFQRAQSAEPASAPLSLATGRAPIHSLLNLRESPQATINQSLIVHRSMAMSPPSNKPSPAQSTPKQEAANLLIHASPVASVVSGSSHGSMRPGFRSAASTNSPAFSISPSWPFQSAQEAKLFYHYVKNISPWIDVCDSYSYFGREVPRRVATNSIISSAIFALASRHLSLLSNTDVDDSPHYVDECLQMLINVLEDPLGHSDENLLAAVILLRSHEELSDNDERCHALGTTRLLNSITAGAGDGGLRESASWICLRQHIYLSLTGQEPLSLDLSNYQHSGVFKDQSDESWANRIIFVFANVLNYVFEAGNTSHARLESGRWLELERQVDNWSVTRPWYFSALWTDTTSQGSLSWPELLVSHPTHAVGLQYYCLCKIVLAIYDPKLSRLGFASHRLRRNSEATVVDHLRMAIGLAVSNPDVTNAMFQGSHILTVCGSYLHEDKDRQAAVKFLVGMKKTIGWNTTHIINDLKEQWQT